LIDPDALAARLEDRNDIVVLDVRDPDEFAEGHVPGSIHIPYGHLLDRLDELPTDREIAAMCSGGKRSGLAASLLQREGFGKVVHVAHGGVSTWRDLGHPVERG